MIERPFHRQQRTTSAHHIQHTYSVQLTRHVTSLKLHPPLRAEAENNNIIYRERETTVYLVRSIVSLTGLLCISTYFTIGYDNNNHHEATLWCWPWKPLKPKRAERGPNKQKNNIARVKSVGKGMQIKNSPKKTKPISIHCCCCSAVEVG